MHKNAVFKLVALVLVALALAACSRPGAPGDKPSMTQQEFHAASTKLGNNMASVAKSAADNQAVAALMALPEGGPGHMSLDGLSRSLLAAKPLTSLVGTLSHGGPHLLRGVYEYQDTDADPAPDAWVRVADSEDLVLRWSYSDEAAHDAELTVNWDVTGATELVNNGEEVAELPTDMSASLLVDGSQVANLDLDADWYDAASCPNPIAEPVSMSISGYLGDSEHRWDFDLSTALAEAGDADDLSSQGSVTATAGGDTASVEWDITASGTLTRGADCFISDATLASGANDLTLSSVVAGDEDSFHIAFGYDDIVWGESGMPESASISEGEINIDGRLAVTFAGTLDDTNGNGVLGENLTVTYAGGETEDLESILLELFPGRGASPGMLP